MSEELIKNVSKSFLCGVPISSIKFSNIFINLDWDSQENLINQTVLHPQNQTFPLKTDYQIAFLKHCIQELEKNNTEEIHDVIYEQLATKLNQENSEEFSFKHYFIDDCKELITIKESNSLIRDGTTGLRLWPASLALAKFIMQNKETFDDKSILELGSGATGFIGLVLMKTCRPKKVLLSDCHDSVLQTLITNVNLNLSNYEVEEMERSLLTLHRVRVKERGELGVLSLPWEEIELHEEEVKQFCQPNVLLAADVVYDDDLFDALISCIKKLFELFGSCLKFYLSQQIRNPETFEKFHNLLLKNEFKITEETLDRSEMFNFNVELSNIKILKIAKM